MCVKNTQHATNERQDINTRTKTLTDEHNTQIIGNKQNQTENWAMHKTPVFEYTVKKKHSTTEALHRKITKLCF